MRFGCLLALLSSLIFSLSTEQGLPQSAQPKITLAPHVDPTLLDGVIYGTVLDQNGSPIRIVLVAEPLDSPGGLSGGPISAVSHEDGRYRFEHLPIFGNRTRYVVHAMDPKAGYPITGLEGSNDNSSKVDATLTPGRPEEEFNLHLPPKAGFLHVHLTDQKTGSSILMMRVTVSTATEPRKFFFSEFTHSDKTVLLPPDKDLFLEIAAEGHQNWSGSAYQGNPIHVPSGTHLTLDVDLQPSR
jgi:hypothetical protein